MEIAEFLQQTFEVQRGKRRYDRFFLVGPLVRYARMVMGFVRAVFDSGLSLRGRWQLSWIGFFSIFIMIVLPVWLGVRVYRAWSEPLPVIQISEEYAVYNRQPLISALTVSIPFFVVWILWVGRPLFSSQSRARRRVEKNIHSSGILGRPISFREYEEAAQILENHRKFTYDWAIKRYPEDLIHILYVSYAIGFVNDKQLRRLVSLKSIRENRAAGTEDD